MALRNDDPDLIDGIEEPFAFAEEPMLNDRKRYTAQLQRRAQAHITAELGGSTAGPDIDRQVTMVVQHARETTGARRVSLFRPVSRGRRWHVATMLNDGSFYYGLAAPDTLQWPRQAFDQKRPFLADHRNHLPVTGPGPAELGISSYICVPVMSSGRAVAVMEAVDLPEDELLEHYSAQLETSAASLANGLDDGANETEVSTVEGQGNTHDLGPTTIIDLVLRQPYDADEAFEVTPAEWSLIANANGERSIKQLADATAMPVGQIISLAGSLIERGLVRTGKENRRRL
jgi:GAF domain